MTWGEIIRRALALAWALVIKLRGGQPADDKPAEHPHITKASVDAQIAHQRELYKRNHPDKG